MEIRHKIYRHDLRCSRSREALLNSLNQGQRELFVWLFFKHHERIEDALVYVLSENQVSNVTPREWREIDAYALDGSKTFVNGRCWL